MTDQKVAAPKGHVLTSIHDIAPNVLEEVKSFLEMSNIAIPVTQLLGFTQFQAHVADTLNGPDTTTSLTYDDLSSSSGPTISGLSAGQYLVLCGFTGSNSGVDVTAMSVSVDGATVVVGSEPVIVTTTTSVDVTMLGFFVATLSGDRVGGHELKAKYVVGGGTGTFSYCRLAAFKFAN